jgi:hypothetical protein
MSEYADLKSAVKEPKIVFFSILVPMLHRMSDDEVVKDGRRKMPNKYKLAHKLAEENQIHIDGGGATVGEAATGNYEIHISGLEEGKAKEFKRTLKQNGIRFTANFTLD